MSRTKDSAAHITRTDGGAQAILFQLDDEPVVLPLPRDYDPGHDEGELAVQMIANYLNQA